MKRPDKYDDYSDALDYMIRDALGIDPAVCDYGSNGAEIIDIDYEEVKPKQLKQ